MKKNESVSSDGLMDFYKGESVIIRVCVSVGSTVVFACIAKRRFLLITSVQV